MRIAPLTIEDRKHPGAEYVADLWRIGAGVGQRTASNPALEQSRSLQKFGKKGELPQRAGAAILIPAHLKSTSRGNNAQFFRLGNLFGNRPFDRFDQCPLPKSHLTHPVTLPIRLTIPSELSLQQYQDSQLRKIGLTTARCFHAAVLSKSRPWPVPE